MVSFTATIKKLGNKVEKTGWIYVLIPTDVLQILKPNNKRTFKVKGSIDALSVAALSVLPVVEVGFIIPLNAEMRKGLNKKELDEVLINIEEDFDFEKLPEQLVSSLTENKAAYKYFDSLSSDEKLSFSNWVKSAKSALIIEKRLSLVMAACLNQMKYKDMMLSIKNKKI
jgi:Domain of unknown function (DUF1905)